MPGAAASHFYATSPLSSRPRRRGPDARDLGKYPSLPGPSGAASESGLRPDSETAHEPGALLVQVCKYLVLTPDASGAHVPHDAPRLLAWR